MPEPTPPAEVDVDEELVRRLLADQHPDLAHRPLTVTAEGWDNVVVRLGDDLAVRVPRRELAGRLIEHELRWLPELAPQLPLPVPVPVRTGRPGAGFPWSWSVVPWLRGRPALERPPDDPMLAAGDLGGFVAALRRPAPPHAPRNPNRGVPLAARRDGLHARVAAAGNLLDAAEVLACWEDLAATDAWSGPPSWLHGDLHPRNLLVDGGRLSAVLDFGDLCAGDPATDLGVAWMLLPVEARQAFRDACGAGPLGEVDDATWRRGRCWALTLGVVLVATAADDEGFTRLGLHTVEQVLADR